MLMSSRAVVPLPFDPFSEPRFAWATALTIDLSGKFGLTLCGADLERHAFACAAKLQPITTACWPQRLRCEQKATPPGQQAGHGEAAGLLRAHHLGGQRTRP